MWGHGRGRKTEWFFRLLFGAGDKASRKHPLVIDGQAHGSHAGSLARFLAAVKLRSSPRCPSFRFPGQLQGRKQSLRVSRMNLLMIPAAALRRRSQTT
jgi:hypothetical protein